MASKNKNKKKGQSDEKKRKKQKHKTSKGSSKNNAVVSSSSETREEKPSEINFTWKMLSRATPDQIEGIIFYIIQECQDYTFKYGYTPWPMITIEKEQRPLYKNEHNQWEIPTDMFLKAAKAQRKGYLRQQREKIEYEKYLSAMKYVEGRRSEYDPKYHPRKLKKLVKKTPFPSHWARHFEVTEHTMEDWAKTYPDTFGRTYYKHKDDRVKWFEKILADQAKGKDKSKGLMKPADATRILQLMDRERYSDKIDINQNTTVTAYKDSTNEKKPSQKKVNKMDSSTIESIFNGSGVSSK